MPQKKKQGRIIAKWDRWMKEKTWQYWYSHAITQLFRRFLATGSFFASLGGEADALLICTITVFGAWAVVGLVGTALRQLRSPASVLNLHIMCESAECHSCAESSHRVGDMLLRVSVAIARCVLVAMVILLLSPQRFSLSSGCFLRCQPAKQWSNLPQENTKLNLEFPL